MKHTRVQLSDHFTYRKLLRFTLPSAAMLVFNSIYGVVDGFFVSNFTNKTQFASVNFIMPFLVLLGGAGFLFGSGGGALIAYLMGRGDNKKACETFSLVVYAAAVCGVVFAVSGFILIRPIAKILGAADELLAGCVLYGRIIVAALPFFILQYEFQCLFAVAEKPKLGLYVTIATGCANMILDAFFVAVFGWGLAGAAIATAAAQFLGAVIPLFYFFRRNTSRLRLGKCHFDLFTLSKAVINGSSELVNSVSAAVVGMLYNAQLMKYVGETGVAAYGVLMYVNFVFVAVFIGYSAGSAPIVGFHYGAGHSLELKSLRKKSLHIIAICALCMFCAARFFARTIASVFVGYNAELMEMTTHAFSIFSFSFLLSGFSIYSSSFFTALGDGLTSALISFLRTLVFQSAAVLLLPVVFDCDGIWGSVVAADAAAVSLSAFFLIAKQKKYGY